MESSNDDVLSLFSGAGGLSYGFSLAGLQPKAAAEINADACGTYRHNVSSECHQVDLSSTGSEFFKNFYSKKNPFAVIGGPPCQGFSTAGARYTDDPRNQLIFNYLRVVTELRPRWFLFENVEGLLTSADGTSVVTLVNEFVKIGYSVRLQKVNFASYGVPQTRKRVVLIGNRLGVDFEFPLETYSFDSGKSKKLNGKPLAPTVDDALASLETPSQSKEKRVRYTLPCSIGTFDDFLRIKRASDVSLHYHTTNSDDVARYELLKHGQTMKDLPEEYWHESFRRRAFRRVQDGTPTEKRGGAPSGIKRLWGNRNSLTITGAASREFIHPHEHRPLTLRECARLQSFPDHYEFVGNSASIAQQIGNAVPPLAAQILATHLADIDGRFGGRSVATHLQPPRLLGFKLTEADGMSPALEKTHYRLASILQEEFAF